MKLAYSYIRFSTKGQITGDSLLRQLESARVYANRHKLHFDERSFKDLGVSGFKGKNATEGELRTFLDLVDEGKIASDATLLIENFDRLSRLPVFDALQLFQEIIKRGITIITLTNEQVFSRENLNNDWTKFIHSLSSMALAHEESSKKSIRSKSGIQAALDRGFKVGKCPVWLETTSNKKAFNIIESKAAFVRKAFALKIGGMGATHIAHNLNAEFEMSWGSPQVARLLSNLAVIGTRISQAGYEPIPDYYPAIIEKSVFYDVQRMMSGGLGTKRGKRPNDEPNLFTGLIKCALCGSTMQYFRATVSVSQRYLKCGKALKKQCSSNYINYDAFEKEFIGALLLDQDEELIALPSKKIQQGRVSMGEVEVLRAQHKRHQELYSSGLRDKRWIVEKLNALDLQISDLLKEIENQRRDQSEQLFPEKAWSLVERHEDAKKGDVPELLYSVRRELRAAFLQSIKKIDVSPELRIDDIHECKFKVFFKYFDGTYERYYRRPALVNLKGCWNSSNTSKDVTA